MKSGRRKQVSATRRATGGAGFDFEDQVSAWLLVKMLEGAQAPAIGGAGTQLQAQVEPLGWWIDDLLLTTQKSSEPLGHLAISVKGNLQVTASGLPADFVNLAWKQFHDTQNPINVLCDGLALVTRGKHPKFDATWKEVKDACNDSDNQSAVRRIRSNRKQSKVFDSVQKPDKKEAVAPDEETIKLIRALHVLPLDFQLAHSEEENSSITQCRQILVSGDASEAKKLWKALITVAKEVRLSRGTVTLKNLWFLLRPKFDLRHHPDYARDWEVLVNITSDYKVRIETELPSGYSVSRNEEELKLGITISENAIAVIFGESGSGKSALVKNVLDKQFGYWTQVWFSPDSLKTALSAALRRTLPLRHELALILEATTDTNNILVIDSAERIGLSEFGVIRQLLKNVRDLAGQIDHNIWHIVVITQTQSLGECAEDLLGGYHKETVELKLLDSSDVKSALFASPPLSWLTSHDDTVAALTNLRTLAWVTKAGADLGSNASKLASHTAIADCLWKYWTKNRAGVQALTMHLAKREASFERSFALTDLDPADVTTFEQRPNELPLHLNEQTNRIEFEHDLAADWARFQYLKQILADTLQWASFAENPLWTSALRMLGQYLLRQPQGNATAWDTAFEAAEGAELTLASNILLDALCLDPEAERFLTERADLLFENDAKLFSRLLVRFHHIGTVPIVNALNQASSLGLYMEAKFRSILIGRWPPVLRFLIGQQNRMRGLVSSSLSKVIHAWFTGTPCKLGDGTLMPFRRDLAEIALAMARTIQVEKGHGVMYVDCEPLLYLAPLAGAQDLPDEIGAWALELAGRKKADEEVIKRIVEIRHQQAEKHTKRLQADPVYKARHEEKQRLSPMAGFGREKLPPWPLGARFRVGMDFRKTCLDKNGLLPLMHACPDVAAEVLLALIIEDEPEREYGSSHTEIKLGLEYPMDGFPTAYWKSPFFSFLQIAPDVALNALIALVNFCTEQWVTEIMDRREGSVPGVTLQLSEFEAKTFAGNWEVFDWTQTNSNHNGNLFSALDALERWLTLQVKVGIDITPHIQKILSEGTSASLIGLLVNIGKFSPSLFSGVLAPMLTDPFVYYWDNRRVDHISYNFIDWSWARLGDEIFELARNWTLAPHRQNSLQDITVQLLITDNTVAARLQALIPTWTLPDDRKLSLEFKLFFAALNFNNYSPTTDSETGEDVLTFECPDDLRLEAQMWQDEQAKPLQYLLMPEQCEKLILAQQSLDDTTAGYLFTLLKECSAKVIEDESNTSKIALAAALIVLAESWLIKAPEARAETISIIRKSVGEIASSIGKIRSNRTGYYREDLKFAAYAVMHLWMAGDSPTLDWEPSVIKLLTSGDQGAASTVVDIAHANRQQLGATWWRLLQVGVLWSGLALLTPHYGDDENVERVWGGWLFRLRHLSLKGKETTVDDLKLSRVAAGCERLDFYRRMRSFTSGDKTWQGLPERRTSMGLDSHFLEHLFHWLIHGTGTGDRVTDTKLISQLWACEAERAKGRVKKDYGEYDLPSRFGYDLLQKLAELSLTAPKAEARTLWKSVLVHGPEAHYALGHFIRNLFLGLSNGGDPSAFECVWREAAEYGLDAEWAKPGLWFHGERLICDLLGFGNEDALRQLTAGAALGMHDVYERWAVTHLGSTEECMQRLCYFLASEFGESLRLKGLQWVATLINAKKPSDYWYRKNTGDALIEIINTSLNQNSQDLIKNQNARQALVEIAAALAARNIPTALALQERIKRLR